MGGIPDLPTRNPNALPVEGMPASPPQAGVSAAPPTAAPSPQAPGQAGPLEPVDDSRYGEPGWVVLADMALGGMAPWLMASVDMAQGRIDENGFEEARQAHQERINALKEQHPEFVQAAEQALPMLAGVIGGLGKGAQTVVGAAGRGSAAGAAVGAAQGFSGGPVETESFSSERMGEAAGGAVRGAAMGAAGGAAAGGVKKGMQVRADKKAEVENRRAENQRQLEESQRARREARIKRDTEAEQQKPKQTEQTGTRSAAKSPDDMDSLWRDRYVKMPKKPDPEWKQNREAFTADPKKAFDDAAAAGMSMDDMARKYNMPPAVIASQLSSAALERKTPGAQKLFNELADVLEAKESIRGDVSRGIKRGKRR